MKRDSTFGGNRVTLVAALLLAATSYDERRGKLLEERAEIGQAERLVTDAEAAWRRSTEQGEAVKRFMREAEIGRSVRHEAVVRTFDVDATLVMLAYLAGLGYANHMAGMLALPAIGIAVLIRKPATLLRWKLILAAVGAMVPSS